MVGSSADGRAFGAEPAEFLSLIDPLELAADRALNGAARAKALHAWRAFPRGFAVVAGRAHRHAKRNPIGLLLWMVDHREHEAAERTLDRAEAEPAKLEGTCFVCSAVGEVFSYAGQTWCQQHYDEQRAFDGEVSL